MSLNAKSTLALPCHFITFSLDQTVMVQSDKIGTTITKQNKQVNKQVNMFDRKGKQVGNKRTLCLSASCL
jgi:hypothetical protein